MMKTNFYPFFRFYTSIMYYFLLELALALVTSIVMKFAPVCNMTFNLPIYFQKEYLKYFDWKEQYELYYQNPFCTICQKLHDKREPVKIYQNMTHWIHYDGKGNKQCTDGSERKYYTSLMKNNDLEIS